MRSDRIDIFIYYTVIHNMGDNLSRLPVSAYILAIIRPIRYLELMKTPHSSPYINLAKGSVDSV